MPAITHPSPPKPVGTLFAWIQIQELPKHLANVLPFLLGTVLAYWAAGSINWAVFWVSFVALYFLTNGTYIGNEYFDYENDKANTTRIGGADKVGVTTTGGTRVLVKGLIPRRHALYASIGCFVLALPFGLYLQFGLHTGPLTIPLGALALFIGWFYTAPPIRASYRGLGELFIAVGQGLVIFGAYYVQQGFSALPLVASLSWFVALPALKVIREFPDYEADRTTDKRGLTIIFGRERMARVFGVMILAALLLFVPVFLMLDSLLAVLLLVPAALLGRSAFIALTGQWRDPKKTELAAVSAFTGLLLIPVTMTVVFLIAAIRRW
ncbi:MAG: prenyltransferase [Gemmatimonadaceae bacterium]|nr:prenyltransferase [Gemmatimonadaceae bacterium]